MELEDFQREFVEVMREVWPDLPAIDVEPKQIYTAVQALQESFTENAIRGTIAFPCVVIEMGRQDPADMGVTGDTDRLPVTVYLIENDGSNQTEVHKQLRKLRKRIDAADATFDHFQPVERGAIDTSANEEVMANLVGESGVKIVAGHIAWSPGFYVFGDGEP